MPTDKELLDEAWVELPTSPRRAIASILTLLARRITKKHRVVVLYFCCSLAFISGCATKPTPQRVPLALQRSAVVDLTPPAVDTNAVAAWKAMLVKTLPQPNDGIPLYMTFTNGTFGQRRVFLQAGFPFGTMYTISMNPNLTGVKGWFTLPQQEITATNVTCDLPYDKTGMAIFKLMKR